MGQPAPILASFPAGSWCTILKGSDTEFCEGDGTTESWKKGYRLPWSLLNATGPSVSKENHFRLDAGSRVGGGTGTSRAT